MTSPAFTTKDLLNQEHALPPRLEDLILAELFLAGGPCYIHRLWAEMFERQKSISVGSLLFTEAVMRLEQDGLLREIEGNRTAITKQGEVHLFGLVLLGMIPDEQKRRLEPKGVLGVALQGAERNINGKPTHEDLSPLRIASRSGEGICSERKLQEPLKQASTANMGCRQEGMGTSSQSLGVAKQASGNPAFGLQVGSNGGGASTFLPSPPFPSDDRFADNIARAIDKFLDARDVAEQERLEEIEAERESSGGIFSTGDPYEMEHNQHGSGSRCR